MRKKYIKPTIGVINKTYGEGLMSAVSMPVSTTPSTGGGLAKPDYKWGYDGWEEPVAGDTNNDW